MKRWWPVLAVSLVLVLSLPPLVFAVANSFTATDDNGSPIWLVVSSVVYGGLGVMLALRRPDLVLPWLLVAFGVCMAWSAGGGAAEQRWSVDLQPWDAVFYLLFAILVGLIVQLFPTGRPVSRRWALVTWSLLTGGALIILGQVLGLGDGKSAGLFGVLGVVVVVVFAVGMFGSIPVVIVRFHRSRGTERAQLKWFLLGVAILVAAWFLPDDVLGTPVRSVVNLGGLAPVVAIAISLMKYRLYDIDRLISRTASYVIVTALVIGTYVVMVTTITSLLPASSSSLAVAAATLTAAAVVRPLLRRVQRLVDRRFDRTHYNRLATINAFGEQARHLVDSDDVARELLSTVDRSLQPTSVALLVRTPS